MNEQILDYFDSECFSLAREYVEQNESTKDRFISYLIENDMITEDNMLDFCQDVPDAIDFDKFVEQSFKEDADETDGLAYEAWKDRREIK